MDCCMRDMLNSKYDAKATLYPKAYHLICLAAFHSKNIIANYLLPKTKLKRLFTFISHKIERLKAFGPIKCILDRIAQITMVTAQNYFNVLLSE